MLPFRLFLLATLLAFTPSQDKVFLCMGSSSYVYHKGQCTGLEACRGEIVETRLAEAIRDLSSGDVP